MIKYKFVFFYTILLFLCSCVDGELENLNFIKVEIPKVGHEIGVKIKMIIPLETNDSSLIGRIEKIEISKDRIIILDSRMGESILSFDQDGKFINKSKQGKGTGELISLVDYYYYDDNESVIQVFDNINDKMAFYDLELNLIDEKKINADLFFRAFTKLPNGDWLTHYQNPLKLNDFDNTDPLYSYLIYSSDFKNVKEKLLADVNNNHRRYVVLSPVSKNNDEFLFFRHLDQSIYTIDENNEIYRKFFMDFGPYNLTNNHIAKGEEYITQSIKENKIVSMVGYLNHSDTHLSCHFYFDEAVHFFIYSIKSKKTLCSYQLLSLPKGYIKGILEDDTFILDVQPIDFIDFVERTGFEYPGIENIKDGDNNILVFFSLE